MDNDYICNFVNEKLRGSARTVADAANICDELIEESLNNGGGDNMSLILILFNNSNDEEHSIKKTLTFN